MKKLLAIKHLMFLLLVLCFSVPMLGQEVVYTLDATNAENKGSNNSYTSSGDVTVGDITWNATGNITMIPWRIGGKSISEVDREVYSKTAFPQALSKVSLEIGNASSITINSIKLQYSTDADFSDYTTITASGNTANTTYDFTPSGGFPANAYYKFVFNVSVSGTSNKFVEFKTVKFYSNGGVTPTTAYTVTLSENNTTTSLTESTAGAGVTLPSRSNVGDWTFRGWTEQEVTTETETKPTFFPAGNYKPTANITLYPVYSKSVAGSNNSVTVDISEYATANNWQGSGAQAYTSINADDNITVSTTGTGNNGKYYGDWSLYQVGKGNAIVTAKDGYKIKKVIFSYTTANTGVLTYNGSQVTTGSEVNVGGVESATFIVGNSGTATNGQVKITAIFVEYYSEGASTYISTPPAEKELIGIEVTGTPAEFWKGDAFNHNGITVTATWDDEDETDVTADCEFSGYDMSTAGEQTVTVTYQGETATYTINVQTIANTQETAYTAAQAKALIDAGKDLATPVYVKGTVSSIVTPFDANYGNITFNIEEGFQFYRNQKTDTDKYTEDPNISVGDDVVGCGKLKKHEASSTYEFDAGNHLVKHDKVATLSIADITVAKDEAINPVVTTNVTGEYLIEYVSNNEKVVLADDNELVTMGVGEATITATLVADGYKTAETTFKVTVVNPVTKYAITVAPMENGSVTASAAEAAEGEEVTLTVTPSEHYSLESLTVAGASGEVTVADGKFTMPAEAVTVSATFVEKAKYTVTIATPANGTLVVKDGETALESGAQVYTGTTLTIECTPAAGYQYKNWQYKEGDKSWITRTTGMTLEVKDNVSIRANFELIPTYTIAWYEDGIEKQKDANKLDGDAVTAYEVQSEINGKKFVGKWMKDVEIIEPQDEVPAYVDAPTTANATTAGNYYAVYATETGGQGGAQTNEITYETKNIPSAYADATDVVLNGMTFNVTQMYKNVDKMQWRAAGNKNGTGAMYNKTAINNIQSIAITYTNDDNNKNFTVKVGNSENPTSGTEITAAQDGETNTYVYDCSSTSPSYFVLTNGSGTGYLSSIIITYGGGGGSVTYSGYTTRPANTVKVESIELSNKTTEFYVDDEFVKATVTAHLDDNTTKDVTNVATFTGYDMTQVGTQTVTVTYLDKTATYDIVVKPQVATPVFGLEPGTYEGTSKKVGISCETTGAKIYYTMTPDVTVPTLYTKQLDVTGETTIVAYAMVGDGSGKRTSESATAEYKLVSVFAPAISPETKTSNEPVAVTITQNSNLTGAKTYVKINNGEAQLYKNAFVVTSTSTVEAYTVAGENESSHVSETYTITAAPTPGGEPITAKIVWAPTSQPSGVNSGSAINSYDLLCKVTSEGADYYDASRKDELVLTEILAANYTKYQALRVGSSGHGGTITLPITPAINVQSITFNAALYAGQTNTETMTVAVNGNPVATKTIRTRVDQEPYFDNFTISMDGNTTLSTITFSSSNYTYLRDVTIVGTTATPVPATGDFKLVTSTDDLVAGREYIVVSKPGDAIYGLSIDNADAHGVGSDGEAKTTKNWRRAETGVTLSENFYTATLEEGSKVSVFTLGGNKETNEWRFNSANGYLVKGATTSAETYLPLLLTADNSEKFSVNVRFDNVAELHFNGADSDRRIKWFSNPSEGVDYPRFGNYSNDNKNYSEVYLYWREAQNEVTLGELEANGIEDNDKVYTITDDLVVFKVVGNTAWAHDMAKSYAYRENTYDATWYGGYNADSYTQHNWVMLTFPEGTDMNKVENHQLSNVKGTYHGHKGVSHEIVVSSFDNAALERENSVEANTYNMASFWDDNTYDYVTVLGKNFFFMNPKIEEVCHITEAVWNGTGFVVPANQTVTSEGEEVHLNSGDLKGGVKVNWAYNEGGAPAEIGEDRYTFLAVVTKNASAHAAGGAGAPAKVAPSAFVSDYVVYPLDFTVNTNHIVTEVKDVDVAGREVKSVRFYDIAGRARSEAQPGINIVVTEYTDGTHSTAKMVR